MPNSFLRKNHKGQSFFRRLDETFRLKELELNAIRRKEKGYDNDRRDEIERLHRLRRLLNNGLFQRKWEIQEVQFLIENHKLSYEKIAEKLGRSCSSIEHKVIRLGLQKNNKWERK